MAGMLEPLHHFLRRIEITCSRSELRAAGSQGGAKAVRGVAQPQIPNGGNAQALWWAPLFTNVVSARASALCCMPRMRSISFHMVHPGFLKDHSVSRMYHKIYGDGVQTAWELARYYVVRKVLPHQPVAHACLGGHCLAAKYVMANPKVVQ